jgi:hypothetical protein
MPEEMFVALHSRATSLPPPAVYPSKFHLLLQHGDVNPVQPVLAVRMQMAYRLRTLSPPSERKTTCWFSCMP